MNDENIVFCRMMMKMAGAEFKKHFPEVNQKKDIWVYNCGGGQFDFCIQHPDHKYHIWVDADNAYHARATGMDRYMEKMGIEFEFENEGDDDDNSL